MKNLTSDQYVIFKRVLNQSRFPTFVGIETYIRCAREGGAFALFECDEISAAALVKTKNSTLMCLSVLKNRQKVGIGSFFVNFLKPNWIRAVESAIPFFESLGYISVGDLKQGRSLKTQIMVRSDILSLGDRVRIIGRNINGTQEKIHSDR